MSDSGATTRRRENTRQRLLDAAAQVFAEVGLDAASVEAVCERAGYTRGAFYSNFDSKEELFLELAARVAIEHVAAVRERVRALEADAAVDVSPATALSLVERVLEVSPDERLGVLLMSEIRIHALRSPEIAEAFLAHDAEMSRSVAQLVGEIARAKRIRLRLSAEDTARILLLVWEGAAERAVMAALSPEELQRRLSEQLATVVRLLIPE